MSTIAIQFVRQLNPFTLPGIEERFSVLNVVLVLDLVLVIGLSHQWYIDYVKLRDSTTPAIASFQRLRRPEKALGAIGGILFLVSFVVAVVKQSDEAMLGVLFSAGILTCGWCVAGVRRQRQNDLLSAGPGAIGPLAESLFYDKDTAKNAEHQALGRSLARNHDRGAPPTAY